MSPLWYVLSEYITIQTKLSSHSYLEMVRWDQITGNYWVKIPAIYDKRSNLSTKKLLFVKRIIEIDDKFSIQQSKQNKTKKLEIFNLNLIE